MAGSVAVTSAPGWGLGMCVVGLAAGAAAVEVGSGWLAAGVGLAEMLGEGSDPGAPGMGISLSGVMLGVGVSLGLKVREAVWLGRGTGLGVAWAPHKPAVLPRQDVRNEAMIAICKTGRKSFMILELIITSIGSKKAAPPVGKKGKIMVLLTTLWFGTINKYRWFSLQLGLLSVPGKYPVSS